MDQSWQANFGERWLEDIFSEVAHKSGIFEHEFSLWCGCILQDSTQSTMPDFILLVAQQLQ